ncbi:MAG: transposase [Acetobacteraceae bacterium]|nr:transposase [Acetobacteraceae bacterium]
MRHPPHLACWRRGGRGLRGARLVISDAHEGLRAAVARVLRATLQRCTVHTLRTQLRLRGGVSAAAGCSWGERNDLPDLQAAVTDDDAPDHQLQDRLLVGEAGVFWSVMRSHALTQHAPAFAGSRDSAFAAILPQRIPL